MPTDADSRALSLVIPMWNESRGIARLLQRLGEDFSGAERIVVDGGSADGSVAAALPHADAVLIGARGRAAQMNLGAAAAQGDYLGFLHADTVPEFGEQALLADLGGAPWAFCRVHLAGRLRALSLIGWFMNRRSRLTSVATGDQFLIVRRDVFEDLGGFAPIPLMEDVELCKRLRRRHRPRALGLRVRASARRWEQHGVLRTVLTMWSLRLGYWLGVSPQRLWRRYYGGGKPG